MEAERRRPGAAYTRGSSMDEHKHEHVSRFQRQFKKFEERRRNLAAKKQRGGPRSRRPRADHPDDDDLGDEAGAETSHEEVPRPRPSRAPNEGAPPPGSRVAPCGGDLSDATAAARVAEVARTEVHVITPEGSQRTVRVAPRVLATGGLVVGDEVRLDGPRGADGPDARVVTRLPRRTLLARRSPAGHGVKLVAANVDLGLVVLTPRPEGLSLGFLERALLALRAGGIAGAAVVTRADVLATSTRAWLEEQLAPWESEGLPVVFVGSPTGEGLDDVRDLVAGRVAVLFGHSGVGKSTLVNALDPEAARAVGDVRSSDGRGRHTTTASRLVPLRVRPGAPLGALVDTPGVRVLVPLEVDPARLSDEFPELAPHAARCRFRDCAHAGEPGCAVEAAAADDPSVLRALRRLRRLSESAGGEP